MPVNGIAIQFVWSISTWSKEEQPFSVGEPHVHFAKVSFTGAMKYGWEDKRASASVEPLMCVVTYKFLRAVCIGKSRVRTAIFIDAAKYLHT